MAAIIEQYKDVFRFILNGLEPHITQRLWSLLSLGLYGPYSKDLMNLFSILGLMHVLVLSGSQVQSYQKVLNRLSIFLGTGLIFRFTASGALGLVSAASNWPAPLTRATLGALCLLWFPRLRFGFFCVFVLVSQIVFFPHHLKALGFYLSWFCWAFLIWAERHFSSRLLALLVVNLCCQILVLVLLRQALPPFSMLVLWVLAGCLAVILFDVVVFPAVGCLYLLVLLLCLFYLVGGNILSLGVVDMALGLFQEILSRLGTGILVALGAFRYTFTYDLQ